MTISIPEELNNPSSISMEMISGAPTSSSLFNSARQTVSLLTGTWRITAVWDLISDKQLPTLRAFILSLNGGVESVYFSDVSAPQPKGEVNAPVQVTGSSNFLTVDVLSPQLSTTIFKAGDYIEVPVVGGTEYKLVKTDVITDGSGLATIEFWPLLRKNVSIGADLVYDDPKGLFIASTPIQKWGVRAPVLSQGTTITFDELVV